MLRILLADDHALVRRGLRVALEERPDWRVCGEAKDGLEAVAQAQGLRPDVVALDLMMPELGGLEACRRIRAAVPGCEVLIFTFQHTEELAAEVLAAGARGYVLKTDPPEAFLAAVEALSEHRAYFTHSVPESVVDRILHARPLGGTVRFSLLTSRERQVAQLVAEGRRTRDVAEALGISEKTVETHRTAIMRKLHLHSLADLVRYAVRNRIVQA
jgi:DNA-binding NarL/FixJ family response regulator